MKKVHPDPHPNCSGLHSSYAYGTIAYKMTSYLQMIIVSMTSQVLRPENEAKYAGMSMGEYLEGNKYSKAFRAHYLLPMCAAVWSVPNSQARQIPKPRA